MNACPDGNLECLVDNQPTSNLWTERLDAAATEARRRLQRRSNGWWRDRAASGGTRADRVATLVEALVRHDPTAKGRTPPPRPAHHPTLADQLTVVLYDLRLAVEDGREVDVEAVLGEVANGLRDVDPRP